MLSGLPSCGRYIVGVTYFRPLLRPRWCSSAIGAPSKTPLTLPSFARNSVMVFAFQSLMLGKASVSLDGDALCAGENTPRGAVRPCQGRGRFVEHRTVARKMTVFSG